MVQRKSVRGSRSSVLWLAIAVVLVFAIALAAVVFVIGPERQLAVQATATAQAHMSEVQRAYAAGVAFAAAGDWEKAAEEFTKVVALEPKYKDAAARYAEALANASAAKVAATAQAVAIAQQVAATATAEAVLAIEQAYQRALAYFNLERWEQARVGFEQVMAINPNYKDVPAKLAEIEARQAENRTSTPTDTPIPTATVTRTPVPRDIVTNGDFEVPSAGAEFVTYRAGQAFGGWVVESGSIDHKGEGYWQAARAKQSVDLNGFEPGAIYQDLPTISGQLYRLRFAVAGNPEHEPDVKRMEVWWGATLVDSLAFDITGHSKTNMGWVYLEYSVVATEDVTSLRFKSLSDGPSGPTLDDVSVR